MFKKGFTLVELIGVVIILALISLLAFPTILNSIRNTKSQLSAVSKEILYSAASSYVSNNLNDLNKKNGNTFCVTLESLVQNEYLPTKVYDSVTGEEISTDNIIEIKTLEYDIYQLQKYSYCQIGAYSTGLYEGLCFQLPTIILKDLPGADGTIEILKYIKKGVYCVKDTNELSKILDSLEKPEKKDIDLLWKSNSLKNIEEEINKIIKNYDK